MPKKYGMILLLAAGLGGCCTPKPYQQIYIIADKILIKKEMASTETIEAELINIKSAPQQKSIPSDPKTL